jgi:hypothetical protein
VTNPRAIEEAMNKSEEGSYYWIYGNFLRKAKAQITSQ